MFKYIFIPLACLDKKIPKGVKCGLTCSKLAAKGRCSRTWGKAWSKKKCIKGVKGQDKNKKVKDACPKSCKKCCKHIIHLNISFINEFKVFYTQFFPHIFFIEFLDTDTGDGTGGNPPKINVYLAVHSETGRQGIPGDAHAVHGLITKDRSGYVVCGRGNELGDDGGGSGIDGFVIRMNACAKQSDYGKHYLGVELKNEGGNCRKNYKWATRIGTIGKYDLTNWVAESPDGTYIVAVGTTNIGVGNKRYLARTVTKIDGGNGIIIWPATLPTDDNLGNNRHSGYESIVFTSDGGFIASGFTNYPGDVTKATDGPMFKSGGHVEEGYLIIEKFSSTVANSDSVNESELVLGKS